MIQLDGHPQPSILAVESFTYRSFRDYIVQMYYGSLREVFMQKAALQNGGMIIKS